MGDEKVAIEKFDEKDYGFWKMHIDYLYGKDLYQPLGEKPKEMKEED